MWKAEVAEVQSTDEIRIEASLWVPDNQSTQALFYIHILVEEFSPELPRPLPDNMLGNLQTLVIECCSITESQLQATLSALDICFRLIAHS